jgi:hypothetical protein
MAQTKTDNFNITAPKDIDNRRLQNGTTVWATKAAAHAGISYKYQTMTVTVMKDGMPTDYWYRYAFATVDDLIEKGQTATFSNEQFTI